MKKNPNRLDPLKAIENFQKAQELIRKKEYLQAAAALAVIANPKTYNYFRAQLTLGDLYSQGWGVKQDLSKTIEYYEMAIKNISQVEEDSFKGEIYFHTARYCENSENPDYVKIKKYYEQACKYNAKSAEYELAKLYEQGLGGKKNKEKAEKLYQQGAKKNDPYSLTLLGGRLIESSDMKQVEQGFQYLQKAKSLGSKSATICILQHQLYHGSVETNDKNFATYQSFVSDDYRINIFLLKYFFFNKKSKYYNALEGLNIANRIISDVDNILDKAYDKNALFIEIYILQLQAFLSEKKYDKAIELGCLLAEECRDHSKQVAEILPQEILCKILHYLALAHYRKGEYVESEKLWQEIYKFKKYNAELELNLNLGNLYFQKSDYDKALRYYYEEYKLDPKNPDLLSNMALVHLKREDYTNAEHYLKAAIALALLNERLQVNLSAVYIQRMKKSQVEKGVSEKDALSKVYESIFKQLKNAQKFLLKQERTDETEERAAEIPEIYVGKEELEDYSAFKLAKTKTPIEKAKEEIKATISKKIWGSEYPGHKDKDVYPIYDLRKKDQVIAYAWITPTLKANVKNAKKFLGVYPSFKQLFKSGMTIVTKKHGESGAVNLGEDKWKIKKVAHHGIGDHRFKNSKPAIAPILKGYTEKLIVLDEHVLKAHRGK